jgi:hypothetical protein
MTASVHYTDAAVTLWHGDARQVSEFIAPESVDLLVTSPPYWEQRAYTDGGKRYVGQMGSEATPREFVDNLITATADWAKVVKRTGSIWVNLGDKMVDKLLLGLPWRYANRVVDELGLILRECIIWQKPNCLSGGTMVYARCKGRELSIRVHDLCRAYDPADVQLWNGEKWTQVLWWQATRRSEGDANIEIELRSGERIGCTREHRWPTRRGLVEAADLIVGDIMDTTPLPDGTATPTGLDDEMVGWFVGLYIAEGSRSEKTIQIAGHAAELDRYKRLCELATAYHGTCNVYPAAKGNGATINLTGAVLNAILDTYVGGRIAKDKHLQPKVWQRSNRFLAAVLDGYLSGDGSYDAALLRWRLGFTANDALASDLRTLGGRLGVSVRLRRGTVTGFGQEWPAWLGTLYKDGQNRRKQPDSQIVAIRQSRARQFWDIGVEDDPHLFALASGVLTHNSLPESVTDRCRVSHEYLFHFTRQGRYFAAMDEIREGYAPGTTERYALGYKPYGVGQTKNPAMRADHGGPDDVNPLGKLPGSVWSMPSEPLVVPDHLGVDHFAAFPSELPRRIILGWSPKAYCTACDEPRRAVVEKELDIDHHQVRTTSGWRDGAEPDSNGRGLNARTSTPVASTIATITGYACACPTNDAPTRPAVVLDPFLGTGTTAAVAKALGRNAIGVDLSRDYLRLAEWRVNDPGVHRKVLERSGVKVPQPPKIDGQEVLFA